MDNVTLTTAINDAMDTIHDCELCEALLDATEDETMYTMLLKIYDDLHTEAFERVSDLIGAIMRHNNDQQTTSSTT